ncbi:MAG: hypothetical protein AMXMBFR84_45720 [Candidatus Hydrogenedentota bacterium]
MIIDSHTHVHPSTTGFGRNRDATPDTFLNELAASPVDIAVLLPIEPIITTEFACSVAARDPKKILCYGSVDPTLGLPAVERLEQLFGAHTLYGLKLHPRWQKITKDHWPTVFELVRQAAKRGRPTIIDCFAYGKGALRDDSLELIEATAEAVPEAKLIIAHMGGTRILDALILARTSYTIYLDLSLILSVYRGSHLEQDIFYAIRRIGADRCLYGSDFPEVGMSTSLTDMKTALVARGFSDDEMEWIFHKTAAHVLGLSK